MTQSIEDIWRDGFAKEIELSVPRVKDLYVQKSQLVSNRVLKKLRIEVWILIPLAIAVFFFNLALGNDFAAVWGLICALPCLVWFLIGLNHIRKLENIHYGENCYEYLVSMRQNLQNIKVFKIKLSVSTLPVVLFPLLVYTYFNNQDKTLGQLIGIENLDWPILTAFLLLSILVLTAMVFFYLLLKRSDIYYHKHLDELISEIEFLKD